MCTMCQILYTIKTYIYKEGGDLLEPAFQPMAVSQEGREMNKVLQISKTALVPKFCCQMLLVTVFFGC